MSDNFVYEIQNMCYCLMDELAIFPGSSEGDEIDMSSRRSGLELERIFLLESLVTH